MKKNKTALVLAGGGLTGAVYEIGALRAIDDLLLDRTVNDFDIYVGTSAGALVAAFIANGLSPQEMLEVLDGTHPFVSKLERKHIFNLNVQKYLRWGINLPGKLVGAWSEYLRNLNDMTLFDLLWSLTETLPSGLYDGLALARFIEQGMDELGLHNNFGDLQRELYISATDLDTGRRAIFGKDLLDAPISQAVAASSALPMMYTPVRIGEGEYIDGGMRGTASIDLAIEKGATLVVVINPLVPFDNQALRNLHEYNGNGKHLSDKGVQSIANQIIRIMLHSGLHYHVKQLRRAHPQVDIILIEPSEKDYQMFFNNIMRYSTRLTVAQHGFKSVTIDLAQDYQHYKEALGRHGIPITRRLVIDELAEIDNSGNDPEVIQFILQARDRDADCGRRRGDRTLCKLNHSLANLELFINDLDHHPAQV